MKHYAMLSTLVFFIGVSFAQAPVDFDKAWKEVEGFKQKGLTQSALDQTLLIYAQAKKKGDSKEKIKALLHQILFTSLKEEEAFESTTASIESE